MTKKDYREFPRQKEFDDRYEAWINHPDQAALKARETDHSCEAMMLVGDLTDEQRGFIGNFYCEYDDAFRAWDEA